MLTVSQAISSVIIGLVQAISEWLPISSKTQVLIASQYLLNLSFTQAYTFGLFMEIGTVVAAILYFRKEVWTLLRVLFMKDKSTEGRNLFKYVLIATIATGIIGTPLYILSDSLTSVPLGIPMMIIGLVLIGDAVVIRHSRIKQREGTNTRKFKDLGLKEYIVIGFMQGLAALPGVSRSGITTSTLLLMKVEPDESFRLSFVIGIFAAIAAFSLTIIKSRANVMAALSQIGITGMLVAIVVAAIVSLFLIDFLIKIAGKSKIVYLTAALGIIAISGGIIYMVFGI
jgi:undecaprenyl-diphosphatase